LLFNGCLKTFNPMWDHELTKPGFGFSAESPFALHPVPRALSSAGEGVLQRASAVGMAQCALLSTRDASFAHNSLA
jgi:hypothetical protein